MSQVRFAPFILPMALLASSSLGCAVKINRFDSVSGAPTAPNSIDSSTVSSSKVLVASDYGNSMLRSYVIESGTRNLRAVSTYPTATRPHYLTGFKAAGSYFAYANDMASPNASIYGVSIDLLSGEMTPLPTVSVPMAAGGNAEEIFHVRQGLSHFLYINDVQNSAVYGFSINTSSGALTALPGSPYNIAYGGSCSWGRMAANSAGTRLYVSCEYDNPNDRILGLSIGATGAITGQLPSSPYAMPAGSAPYDMALTPDEATLYVSFAEASAIGAYSVDSSDGSLTSALPGSPFVSIVTGTVLGNLWLDPTLSQLYLSVFGSNTDDLQVFQVNGSRALSVAQSPISASGGGSDVTGSLDGSTVIFSSAGGGLGSYTRNPTTGTLSQNGALVPGTFDGVLLLE